MSYRSHHTLINLFRTLALNFSAALDELFKLGATEELAQNVEQK